MIISSDKNNIDHVVYNILKDIDSSIPLVPVTRLANYEFNDELLKLDKYILVNYNELDWNYDWKRGTPIFGKNAEQFRDKFPGDEWSKFIDFVNKNPPLLTFQRELLKTDVSDTIKSIEFPNFHPPIPIQTKEQYDARPISVFNFWGRSHESRVQLHGDIWKGASKFGYSVCDNIYHFPAFMQEEKGDKWVSLYMPHYSRVDIQNILGINGLSKLSISLPGAGIKCFRSTGESGVNSCIVMPHDELAWTYPFEDGINCIKFIPGKEIETLQEALKMDKLYDIYCESVNTTNKYYQPDYISNYILPLINSV